LPELPEVETTRRGILPHVCRRPIKSVIVRQPKLRWPVSPEITRLLPGKQFLDVIRRGKYLLLKSDEGSLLIHLGMSGSLRIVRAGTAVQKHDHADVEFADGTVLRFTDPRRFGCLLWLAGQGRSHALLDSLGPEPLSDAFDGDTLFARSRGRKLPVKLFIMDSKIVVGVGNIYANEALFAAGINPNRGAGRISRQRYQRLAETIRQVLDQAITAGGTTLRDFTNSEGKPGYFKQSLQVYGRAGQPCLRCQAALKESRLGGRSTVYCSSCQR
jgi:formamidopyrimidine-DNA glycosylase